MDPYGPPLTEPLTPQEKQLMNEVIFLHYLWHQGPPSAQFTRPNPNPNLHPHPHRLAPPHPHSLSRNLGASSFPTFKQKTRKGGKKAKRRELLAQQTDPGPDWPIDSPQPSPTSSTSGWPPFDPNPAVHDREVSEPNFAKIEAMQLQQTAARRFKEFLAAKRADSDATGEEEDEEDEDDEGEFTGSLSDVLASEEYKFLLGYFTENHELRQLYETSQANGVLWNGELYCIVCEAMGVKKGRTFMDVPGVVHHALNLKKTTRRRSHRALGQVLFRVFGWDISRYPLFVVKDEPLSLSLKKSGQIQSEPEGTAACTEKSIQDPDSKIESLSGNSNIVNNVELSCGESSSDHQNKSILVSGKTCVVGDDAVENPVVLSENIQEETEETA